MQWRFLLLSALALMATFGSDRRRDISAGSIFDLLPQVVDGEHWRTTW
jgi:hypothetical protein